MRKTIKPSRRNLLMLSATAIAGMPPARAASRPASPAVGSGGNSAHYYGIPNDGSDVSARLNALLAQLDYGSTIFFEPGRYGVGDPITMPPRAGDVSGLMLSGTRGAIFSPLRPLEAMFRLTGDQIDIAHLSFHNQENRAAVAVKIVGEGTNNRRIVFTGNEFSRFDWAIDSGATDLVDTMNNNCLACRSGFIRFSSNGMNSTHFGNYVLGGKHGFYFTHDVAPRHPTGVQAEGVRILSNTIMCSAAGAQSILLNGGLEVHMAHNIIDDTGREGVGIDLVGERGKPLWGIKIGPNWIVGGAGGTAIRSRGPVRSLWIGNTSLAGGTGTAGLDLEGVHDLRIDGAQTIALKGPAAKFVSCDGEIRSTNFDAGAGVHEDMNSTLLWIGGNRKLPDPDERSSRSVFAYNFEDVSPRKSQQP